MRIDPVIVKERNTLGQIIRGLDNGITARENMAPEGIVGQVLTSRGVNLAPMFDDLPVTSDSGKVSSGSNLGAGIAVFDSKSGVDLQFHSLVAASSKMSVSLDVPNNEIDLDVVEANINHAAISNIGVNSHPAIDSHIADGTIHFTDGDDLTAAKLVNTAGRIKNTTRATTTYQVLVTDYEVFGNTDGSAWTMTLPVGAQGQALRLINSGSSLNDLTIAPSGAEDLLGVNANFALADGEVLEITYDTTDGWY